MEFSEHNIFSLLVLLFSRRVFIVECVTKTCCFYCNFYSNSSLFRIVVSNLNFVKIFGTFLWKFWRSKPPVFFRPNFGVQKTGKSERPESPKDRETEMAKNISPILPKIQQIYCHHLYLCVVTLLFFHRLTK